MDGAQISNPKAGLPNLHLVADMGFADSFSNQLKRLNLLHSNHVYIVGKSPDKVYTKGDYPYTNLKGRNTPHPNNFRKVFVHFLLPMVCHWLKEHKGLKIHWVFYGAEVYRNPLVRYDPIGPKTQAYQSFNLAATKRYIGYYLMHRKSWRQALKQVASVLIMNPKEYELIQSLIPVPRATMEPFFYGKSFHELLSVETAQAPQSSCLQIQVGHCAFPSVNHLDFLENQMPPETVQWHLPLSYGDDKYAQWLTSRLSKRSDVKFLMTRVPIDQYLAHIDSMDAGVFPNIRQQGLANINSFILRGKPIFLHPQNPTYSFYQSMGIKTGSVEAFSLGSMRELQKYTQHNEKALLQHLNIEVCADHYKRLFA